MIRRTGCYQIKTTQ